VDFDRIDRTAVLCAADEKTGLKDDPDFARQMDAKAWPDLKQRTKALFLTKTRDEWCAIMDGTDICFAPVLSLSEAPATRTTSHVARS
jgi:crotonobetainyl-CoA:carnitine CoA-transferase CaiB-like acyl-CoA transferase